jgi:hypothetical protein
MVYRNVAALAREGRLDRLNYNRFAFIGFNALNPCETELFRALQADALFYWDYDEHYLGNEIHEAGRFIRENLGNFRDDAAAFDHKNLVERTRDINVYSIPSDSGQAQLVHSILEKTLDNGSPGEETAIILADEELLIPVLNSLPGSLGEINVTMGYPISATPVFSLIEHVIEMQRNLRENPGGEVILYYKDVLPVLQHQYITLRQRLDSRELAVRINEQNQVYIKAGSLGVNPLFREVFRKISHPDGIAAYLLRILEMITADEGEGDAPVPALELEFIYRIYTRIKRLKDVLTRLEIPVTLNSFLRLFYKFLRRTRIPFSGEPLAGIQVMGVLETRVLDFERILILSMNEGALPGRGHRQSFIPHSLRLGFRLPTLEYQDAIYAYYFYRLIQRPSEVHLIYNNRAEGLRTGERSRYIYQLRYNPAFRVIERSGAFDIHSTPVRPIRVEKTASVIQKMMEFCSEAGSSSRSYLSPSALNSFIDCSLQFYFRYIAGIKETEQLKEEIDPALFGTILHKSVQLIYGSLVNPIGKQDLMQVGREPGAIRDAIDESFREHYFGEAAAIPTGRNKVIAEIIYSYIMRILEKDMEYCPFGVVGLEQTCLMDLPVVGQGVSVRIGGQIDRIDRLADRIRILDYKTGTGGMTFPTVGSLFEQDSNNRNRAVFQTLLYARLFKSTTKDETVPLTPGIYLIREIFDPGFRYHFSMGSGRKKEALMDYSKIDDEYTSHLAGLLGRMYDAALPFEQTPRLETCLHCPYRGICHR